MERPKVAMYLQNENFSFRFAPSTSLQTRKRQSEKELTFCAKMDTADKPEVKVSYLPAA